MAFTRAKRSATGSGARTNPTRSPPQKRLLSEPDHRDRVVGPVDGDRRRRVVPREPGEGVVLDERDPGVGEQRRRSRARRPAASTAPVGLCSGRLQVDERRVLGEAPPAAPSGRTPWRSTGTPTRRAPAAPKADSAPG